MPRAWSDVIVAMLGRVGANIVTRLFAFLLLSVGVELVLHGLRSFVSGSPK